MFHHFHDDFHKKSQGSIDEKSFNMIIDYLESKYDILPPDLYIQRFESKALTCRDICITFDDSLRCQYDIAFPILKKRNIKAFFFIYSSTLTDNPDKLELYRLFRNEKFKNIDHFYSNFFKLASLKYEKDFRKGEENFQKSNYLQDYKFYSYSDKFFRFLRDIVFNDSIYEELMNELFKNFKFDIKSASERLWMSPNQIKDLYQQGHEIGLHSHSHPFNMDNLNYDKQEKEYSTNLYFLENIIGKNKVRSMSHPCGRYNSDTLKILNNLNVIIGFGSNLKTKNTNNNLEIPREDHINILNSLKS
tara:strand:- start:26203 stop:27114 length:912 start_codon:yes stop_codon:yes gene_type:complete